MIVAIASTVLLLVFVQGAPNRKGHELVAAELLKWFPKESIP